MGKKILKATLTFNPSTRWAEAGGALRSKTSLVNLGSSRPAGDAWTGVSKTKQDRKWI